MRLQRYNYFLTLQIFPPLFFIYFSSKSKTKVHTETKAFLYQLIANTKNFLSKNHKITPFHAYRPLYVSDHAFQHKNPTSSFLPKVCLDHSDEVGLLTYYCKDITTLQW